ncbi:hypothetical protein A7X67_14085 [Clostridium sp. W14A]|nr:hypothetical protein A7X67_14085 [Clostridium sp. W14A]
MWAKPCFTGCVSRRSEYLTLAASLLTPCPLPHRKLKAILCGREPMWEGLRPLPAKALRVS